MIEYIICAAIWFQDGKKYEHQPKNIESGMVIAGRRHHNCYYSLAAIAGLDARKMNFPKDIQGFLTNTNRFVDRKEAAEIALSAQQISKPTKLLFSEDLY